MANELKFRHGITYSKGGVVIAESVEVESTTISGDGAYQNMQNVGTTHEALALGGDIASYGLIRVENLDASNFVEVGVEVAATFYGVVKIPAGKARYFNKGSSTLYVKADTGAVKIQVTALPV